MKRFIKDFCSWVVESIKGTYDEGIIEEMPAEQVNVGGIPPFVKTTDGFFVFSGFVWRKVTYYAGIPNTEYFEKNPDEQSR